jgi:hypothetical protein
MGLRGALRCAGRLRHKQRDGAVSTVKSTATEPDARWAARPGFASEKLGGSRPPRLSTASGEWPAGVRRGYQQSWTGSVAQVEATQHVAGSDFVMQVVTYEMLLQEEKNRQVAALIIGGFAAGVNTYSASQAGHERYTTTSGRTGTFYSPTAAVIAHNNAAAQNEAIVAATVETGQRNMAVLEQSVIKDNTLMPGEWYGGQLHIAPPTEQAGGQKAYTIVITVGSDRHVIDIAQAPAGT